MFHSSAFDFSVWEVWGALLTGGRLVIVPYETCRDPQVVCALIEAEKVTVLNQSPAAFGLLMQAESRKPESVSSLRYVIFGGEALNLRALLPWFERHGDGKPALINMYGITETTVHVTYRRILHTDAQNEGDSLIGVPIPDLSLHILDEQFEPANEGELYVGGAGVARGYWNKPELTAERFMDNPFGEGKLYRSGDLARRRADGELVYLGRGDRQVKLRGFRIELGEIEAVLFSHGRITQVVVDVLANGSLAAFFSGEARVPALTAHAAALLPDHMRPTRYIPVSAMPLTINGKIDRAALAAIAESSAGPAPSNGTTLENRIALVWQKVLASPAPPSVEINFFEAGGNSLLLHSLRVALENELSQPVSILTLFQFPTIRSFAGQSAAGRSAKPETPRRTGFRSIKHHGKVAR